MSFDQTNEKLNNNLMPESYPTLLLNEMLALIQQLQEAAHIDHYICDEDCWYSCPKSGRCCQSDIPDECNCGAANHNAKVDVLAARLKAKMSARIDAWKAKPKRSQEEIDANVGKLREINVALLKGS